MSAPLTPDAPICTTEAARAAGLDVAPSPSELTAMAETIVSAADSVPTPEVDLARAVPLMAAEVDRLRAELAEVRADANTKIQEAAELAHTARRERDEARANAADEHREMASMTNTAAALVARPTRAQAYRHVADELRLMQSVESDTRHAAGLYAAEMKARQMADAAERGEQ